MTLLDIYAAYQLKKCFGVRCSLKAGLPNPASTLMSTIEKEETMTCKYLMHRACAIWWKGRVTTDPMKNGFVFNMSKRQKKPVKYREFLGNVNYAPNFKVFFDITKIVGRHKSSFRSALQPVNHPILHFFPL